MLWTDLLVIQGSLRGSESLTFTQLLCLPPRNTLWFDLMLHCLSASVCESSPQPPDTLIFTSSSLRLESAVLWTMDMEAHWDLFLKQCFIIKAISNSNSLCLCLYFFLSASAL